MIIDLDGFHLKDKFHVRELGYYSWMGDSGSHFFDVHKRYRELDKQERAVVKRVCRDIIGLPFRARPCETPHHHVRNVKNIVKDLYKEFRTEFRTVVGFKGGTIEKDLLISCQIPYVDLEKWGCPKYDCLPRPEGCGCGFHEDPKVHHCPQMECESFWNWSRLVIDN